MGRGATSRTTTFKTIVFGVRLEESRSIYRVTTGMHLIETTRYYTVQATRRSAHELK